MLKGIIKVLRYPMGMGQNDYNCHFETRDVSTRKCYSLLEI